MDPVRQQAEDLVRDAICGSIAAEDPRLRAALARFPDLRDELRSVEAVAGRLGQLGGDAAAVRAAAAAEITAADAQRVAEAMARSLPPAPVPRRRWVLVVCVAAAAVVLAAVSFWPRRGAETGMLGGSVPMQVDRVDGALVVTFIEALPPDGEYRLQLVPAGVPAPAPQRTDQPRWTFPPAWLQALERAGTAQLEVQLYVGKELQGATRVSVAAH
jgi:hypothetical protein